MGLERVIVGALLLAAGLSRRMGRQKLLIAMAGQPMVVRSHALLTAAGLPVLLVTGADGDAVAALLPDTPRVHAADHARGLAHSLRAGLGALPAGWGAFLVHLADMPFVEPATVRALATALAAGAPAAVPAFEGRRGNPAGFAAAAVPALLGLSGDSGARSLLDPLGVMEVAVDDRGILRDVDRPEDLP